MGETARLSRFVLVGMLATLIHVVIFAGLIEVLGATPLQACIPAFVIAMLVSYALNRAWTFSASGRHCIELPRYASISLLGLSLNVLITYVAVNILHWWYVSALALIVLVVPVMTFCLNRRWTFKPGLAL